MTNVHQELVDAENEDISESLCTTTNVHQESEYIPESLCAQSSSTTNEAEGIPCSTSNRTENRLSSIKLSPKMKNRRRLKRAETTVFVLRQKKFKSRPVAFENLFPETKERIMLS